MSPLNTSTHPATAAPYPMIARPEVERNHAGAVIPGQAQRVLRNTYALLSMTLLFSAAVAAAGVAFKLPAPGLVITLVGYFGLLFAVHKLQNSGWALPAVFGFGGSDD